MTILDLTVTLTLLGLLVTAAVPTYSQYTERLRVNRAIGEISRVSIALENWRTKADPSEFPANLAEAGIDIGVDPWGNAYNYTRLGGPLDLRARTAQGSIPANSDFDLYSNGPDGLTARGFGTSVAHDDIVRAGNGTFVGIAEQY